MKQDSSQNIPKASREELKEALSAQTVGLSFLEKVILALIDAHPDKNNRSRDERLKEAMYAVRGEYYRHGKKDKNDKLLLLWMASQYINKQKFEKKHKYANKQKYIRVVDFDPDLIGKKDSDIGYNSLTELARAALDRFDAWETMTEPRGQTQRLMDKFTSNKDELIGTVQFAEFQPHVIEYQILERMAEDFDLTNTPFRIPKGPEAF